MLETCRLCLKQITDTNFVNFDNRSDVEPLTVKEKLAICIPEIDATLVIRSVICAACARTLNSIFQFKCSCLEVEKCIRDYINSNNSVQIKTLNAFKPKIIDVVEEHEEDVDDENLYVTEKPEKDKYADDDDENNDNGIVTLLSNDTAVEIELATDVSMKQSVTVKHEITEDGSIEIECPEEPDEDYIMALLTLQNPNLQSANTSKSTSSVTEKENRTGDDLGYYVVMPDGNNALYVCSVCNYRCVDENRYQRHLKGHVTNVKQQFQCTFCDYTSTQKVNVKTHIAETHKEEKPFECNICQSKFTVKSSLEYHLKNHKAEKPLQCPSCDYRTAHTSNLRKHLKTHTGEKPFMCEICSQKFARNAHLQRHLVTHSGDKGEKPFACKECDRKFAFKYDLQLHTKKHNGIEPHICKMCNFHCSSRISLKFHIKRHLGEKPFKCNLCSYKCLNKLRLKHHIRTHTGEKPFTCQLCHRSFAVKASLKIHMRIHTQEKPYVCETCGYQCKNSSGFLMHKRSHTGEKRYACDFCERRFTKKVTLTNHMKLHDYIETI